MEYFVCVGLPFIPFWGYFPRLVLLEGLIFRQVTPHQYIYRAIVTLVSVRVSIF